ncbi:hypothetical protein K502DRAFT_347612 [Neoconidiobolus thromboides FSU 785]|nr:hypothetical protein K502DRAFT_347612 [Neoconidiobolus thromboides FSU 785]
MNNNQHEMNNINSTEEEQAVMNLLSEAQDQSKKIQDQLGDILDKMGGSMQTFCTTLFQFLQQQNSEYERELNNNLRKIKELTHEKEIVQNKIDALIQFMEQNIDHIFKF